MVAITALTVAVMVVPGTAVAQEYPNVGDNNGGNIDQPTDVRDVEIARPGAPAAPDVAADASPAAEVPRGLAVTGADIAVLVAMGVGAIAFGTVLRRRARALLV